MAALGVGVSAALSKREVIMQRRQFLRTSLGTVGLIASVPLLQACGAGNAPTAGNTAPASTSASQPRSINMMMNGGLYQEVATRVVLDPFSKAHNVTINVIPSNSAPMLTRAKAEAS